MFGLFDVSTSGLVAQRVRLETISANLANQNTLLDAQGNYAPWKRRQVEFAVGASRWRCSFIRQKSRSRIHPRAFDHLITSI